MKRWACFSLAAALLAALLVPGRLSLTVETAGARGVGRLLLARPVEEGEELAIEFLHSRNLSPIRDVYEVQGKTLLLSSTCFQDYGAGLPLLCELPGAVFAQEEEGFVIRGIGSPRWHIPLLLSEVPDAGLYLGGSRTDLLSLAPSGSLIDLKVRRVSLLERLLGMSLPVR